MAQWSCNFVTSHLETFVLIPSMVCMQGNVYVHCLCMVCANLQGQCMMCTYSVHGMFMSFTGSVHFLYMVSQWYVPGMFMVYACLFMVCAMVQWCIVFALSAHGLFMACARFVSGSWKCMVGAWLMHGLCVVCVVSVHGMYHGTLSVLGQCMVCSWSVQGSFMVREMHGGCLVYAWSVHGMFMVCAWYVPWCMVCAWSAQGLFTVLHGLFMVRESAWMGAWPVHGLCRIWWVSVLGMCMVCVWYVHGLSVHTLSVRGLCMAMCIIYEMWCSVHGKRVSHAWFVCMVCA